MSTDHIPWIVLSARQRRHESREHKRRFVKILDEREQRRAMRHTLHWRKENRLSRADRRLCRERWAEYRRTYGPGFITPGGRSFPKHCRYTGGKDVPVQIRPTRYP